MQELAARLNALCDALPFQTSWYLKDLKTGATADRLGDVPVPSASTRKISILMAALKAVHDGKLSLDQKVTIEAKYQDNDSGTFQHMTPGLLDHLPRRARADDHRERQHVHGHGGGPGRARRRPALLRVDRHDAHHPPLRHPAAPRPRPHAGAGDDDHAQRPGHAARDDPARRVRQGGRRPARLHARALPPRPRHPLLAEAQDAPAVAACRSAPRSPTRRGRARAASWTRASSSRGSSRSSS